MMQENPPTATNTQALYVAALGASAGGIDALMDIVPNLPRLPELAIVVIQHHHPDGVQALPEILARQTALPTVVTSDALEIQGATLYIVPPGHDAELRGRQFKLEPAGQSKKPSPSIDAFFASLAEGFKEKAIGVILTGTGVDGARGIRDIKAADGLCLVQNEESAQYPGMPREAMKTGCADLVLPPDKIGERIEAYIRSHIAAEKNRNDSATDTHLESILELLFKKTGCDFSEYKRSTINRRIGRRMALNKFMDMQSYTTYLSDSPEEIKNLFNDLLITITSFFRDPEAFDVMETVLQKIAEHQKESRKIRIWIPGCATGEEVYSMAISLAKVLGGRLPEFNIQIFATDIDPEVVEIARKGIYSASAVSQIAQETLKNYFVKSDGSYQIAETIRNMIVFSQHDLLKDPPFSRLDLVSCRNVLIYFNAPLQKRLMSIFHYALNANGYLFLGKSESGSQISDLFVQVDGRQKIFQRRGVFRRPPLQFQYHRSRNHALNTGAISSAKGGVSVKEAMQSTLLKVYGCCGVLVNDHMDIVYIHGNVGPYLGFAEGKAELNILSLAKGQLGLDLRIMINKSMREGVTLRSKPACIDLDASAKQFVVCTTPVTIPGAEEGLTMVAFEELPIDVANNEPRPTSPEGGGRVRELENELTGIKEHLQATIEELESTNQDLLSLNEELQSTNEEMQSTNEELETSNEELQAANEELITVNRELELKTEALSSANKALFESEARFRALFENVPVGIGVAKRDGTLLSFNEAWEHITGYPAQELGTLNIRDAFESVDDRHRIVRKVDRGEAVRDFELLLKHKDEAAYSANLSVVPLTMNQEPVLLTVVQDISDRKEAEMALRKREADLAAAQQIAHIGSWDWDLVTDKIAWSDELFRIYGLAPKVRKPDFELAWASIHPDDKPLVREALDAARNQGWPYDIIYRIQLPGNEERYINSMAIAEKDDTGKVIRIYGTAQDITERKKAEQERQTLEKKLLHSQKMEAVGTLAGGIAHDFNNILSIILGNSELALEDLPAWNTSRKNLEEIRTASLRARDLVRQLLNFSRGAEEVLKPVNMAAMIKDSLKFLRAIIPTTIDIRHEISDAPGTVIADPTQLHQIMINLCANAADAMAKNGGSLSIDLTPIYLDTVSAARYTDLKSGHYMRLRVSDTGDGIESHLHKRIFEPFFTTKAVGKGTGMGLAMVHGIVKNYGGDIQVVDDENSGATFEILLPKVEAVPSEAKQLDTELPKGVERILIVDDEEMLLKIGKKMLEALGYTVTAQRDGASALKLFRDAPSQYDIVISDQTMPRMTGYDLAKALIDLRPDIPVILCTGYSETVSLAKAKEAGIREFVMKPFQLGEIARIIRKILDGEAPK